MISVCIPTYNGEKYLKQQLDSILVQLEKNDEIIVSDDSSTDSTINLLKSYQDPRIRILQGNLYKNPIFNLENALKHAKGDYIFTADQDDIWKNDKVKQMIQALQKYDLVVSDASIINKNGEIIVNSFFKQHHSHKGYWKNLWHNHFLGCCMAFRKDCLQYILPFPKRIAMHDIWIGLCVELHGNTFFLPEKLIYYRRHGNNASQTGEKSRFTRKYQLYYRVYLLVMTTVRRIKSFFILK